MAKFNLVYFGTPDFSAEILEALIDSKIVNVVGIVTQKDKPVGRKQILTPSPVATIGNKYNLPVFKAEKLDDANLQHLRLLKPDIFLAVSYGKILPSSYLKLPTHGVLNIHFSLLPKYRGALCISEALRNGDAETGVSLMLLDEGMDTGPLLAQIRFPIALSDDNTTLTDKLTHAAIQLLKHEIPLYLDGAVGPYPQDESQMTITPSTRTRTRQSAFITWEKLQNPGNPLKLHNLIRSLNPDPGAWTTVPRHSGPDPESIQIKILSTTISNGKLVINTVQLPGKNPISWKQFQSGYLSLK